MGITVASSDNPASILAYASAFLASEPVLHNLILTLLRTRVAQPEPGRYWVASNRDRIVGVVLQSPLSFPATLTPMEIPAVVAMVDAIAGAGIALPGVNGDAPTASRFAGQWTERCRSGAVPFQGQRLYEARDVGKAPAIEGELRKAHSDDRGLVIAWVHDFYGEIGEPMAGPEPLVDRWLPAGQVWLWDDGRPRSIAITREPVEKVVRVAGVYTPPDQRKHGYAEACVSHLTKRILASGDRPILYTDLGNPASNSIYRRIGYRVVAEALRYHFEY
jgi:hypothetical protein